MPTISNRAIFNPTRGPAISNPPAPQTPVAAPCCCPVCTGLQCLDRTRFFAGQLLTEADLNNDQSYWLAKSRLHNRYLFGWGVVCGLQVVCGPCPGWVTINTGYGLDPCGNDIIVCADQPFNVLKAIQACCTPATPPDCSPLRSATPPNCQDAQQKWCITIQYEEQPTRPVTPLVQKSSTQTGGCGCGGSSKGTGGGGCGCGGGKQSTSSGTSTTACCCSTTPTRASTTPGCEPTRILEGFKLGICPAPPEPANTTTSQTGTFTTNSGFNATSTTGNVFTRSNCYQAVQKLILQQPSVGNVSDPNTIYTQACNYLSSIRTFLASGSFSNCKATDTLNNETIPKPNGTDGYPGQVQTIVTGIVKQLTSLLLDCFCLSLLPTCPPDPCTNCLVLACVTVQNGEIVDICHFGGGRQQVVSFPSLGYWLSLFGLNTSTLTNLLEGLCCGTADFTKYYQSAYAPAENLTASNVFGPAMLNQTLSAALTQTLGATVVNAAAPGARTVDLRPLVGLSVEQVSGAVKNYGLASNTVEASAAWTDTVAAQGQAVAPAAFPADQSVTILTRNNLVIGFQPTSPTDALKLQLADLQTQVTALQNALGNITIQTKPPRKG